MASKDCAIFYATISSPVGDWAIESCSKGLHSVNLAPEVNNENFLKVGKAKVVVKSDPKDFAALRFHKWMETYFSGRDPAKVNVSICDS